MAAITKKAAFQAVVDGKVTPDIVTYFKVELEKIEESEALRKRKSASDAAEIDALVLSVVSDEPQTAKEIAKALGKKMADAPKKGKVVASLTRLFNKGRVDRGSIEDAKAFGGTTSVYTIPGALA